MPRNTTKASSLRLLAWAACSLGALAPSAALAQDNEEGFNKKGDDAIAADKQAKDEKSQGDRMPGERDKKAEEQAAADRALESKTDPREDPLKSYYFVGVRFRDVVVPKFILNIFADGGRTVNVATIGPEFSSRKNKVEYAIGLSYADYSMDAFLFKGKNDSSDAWERVSSDLKVLYVNIDLLYELWEDRSGRFAFMIGGGLGIGGVLGDLRRNQVYPNSSGASPDDPSAWSPCLRQDKTTPFEHPNPETGNTFCDGLNQHYLQADGKDWSESSWANGGSLPFIIPWLAIPQISFRVKPIKQLQMRADLGFSVTGFYWGMSLAYGI